MKSHDRNQSSANFSRLCLRSKSNASCSHDSTIKSEKISKYFVSPTKCDGEASTSMDMRTTSDDKYKENCFEDRLSSISIETPYNLTQINSVNINTSINEEKDFKTPNRVFKRNLRKLKSSSNPSINVRKRGRKPKTAKDSKTSKHMFLTKTSNKNLSEAGDVNLEHLHLAIALSKSLQDGYKNEGEENKDHASPSTSIVYPSTQQKEANIKETLLQFRLKAKTNRSDVQQIPVKRKKKTSRKYKYITPVLLLRTEKDREKLVSEKVTLVLSQNLQENVGYSSYKTEEQEEPVSEKLKNHWSGDKGIFKLNNFKLDTLKNNDVFYVKSLNIPPNNTKCGNLLKDWTKIPGRDKSPLRKYVNENQAVSTGDNNQTCSLSEQCHKENSNFINTATNDDTLSKIFKNNLQIKSFSNRSISPELFESDEEIVISDKKSSQEILISLDEEHSSQSFLNLSPRKNKSAKFYSSFHLNPDKSSDSGEDLKSESLLSITPTKKNKSLSIGSAENSNLDMNDATSPSLIRKSMNLSLQISNFEIYTKNKPTSSDLSESDLFVNDNGICTYECFSNDNICFDLTHSSDEENNGVNKDTDTSVLSHLRQSSNEISILKDVSFDNPRIKINKTLLNISPIISPNIQPSLSTGVSEIMQESMYFHEENVNISDDKDIPETTRQSKSFNITEYISNMLNEEQMSVISYSEQDELEPKQNPKADKNIVFDLTQSATGSSCSIPTDCNFTIKRLKENVSESNTDDTLSPVKSNKNNSISKFEKHDSFKSTTSDEVNLSQGSQESICISDEELNYSSLYGTPRIKKKQNSMCVDNYLYEISDDSDKEAANLKKVENSNYDNVNLNSTPKTSKEALNNKVSDSCEKIADLPTQCSAQISAVKNSNFDDNQLILQHPRIKNLSTGVKSRKSLFDGAHLLEDSLNAVLEDSHLFDKVPNSEAGPSNISKQVNLENENWKPDETKTTPKSEMIIKTTNVTPMTNYNEMDTPKISKELQKFGLKPLKRQRGVQILKHIYESTHPVVGQNKQYCEETESDDKDHRVIKKRKSNTKIKSTKQSQSPKKRKSPKDVKFCNQEENASIEPRMENVNIGCKSAEEKTEIVGDLMGENETIDNLIFERKHSTKISSCRVPLHIAWHNLVSSQPELRKNIVLYEPLQLEVLYKLLKEQGYKYHIQDLLTFLDRKCITIRTNQNQHRNSRRRGKSVSPQKC